MGISSISFRIGIQQRILPVYRAPFFEAFCAVCDGGLSLLAGLPMPEEAVEVSTHLNGVSLYHAKNIHVMRGMAYLCWQSGIIRWLEQWKPDILIVEANPRYLRTPAAVKWMKQRSLPVIGWGLGSPPVNSMPVLRSLIRKNFYGNFDAMIAYSSQGALQYSNFGFPPERVFIARNAASPRPKIAPASRPDQSSDHKPVILFVGRLVERKRVDLLISACAELGNFQPDLWVVGDGPHRPALETFAKQVYPSTRFWGAMYGSELDHLFDQADLFVLPGTGGLAVQQAMSHALPVIVAEADGTQDDLVSTQNGWVVPTGDLNYLRQTIAEALADPVRLRKMGLASYKVVSEEINLENMVDGFVQAVRSVKR